MAYNDCLFHAGNDIANHVGETRRVEYVTACNPMDARRAEIAARIQQ